MQTFKRFRANQQVGQAIVLIALLMVILLGATGLAIDGGGLFLLYRDAQNATDAAALSAAYAMCTDGDVQFAGINAARLNGFINGGTDTVVTISNPPVSGDYAGDTDYVQASIMAEKPSYFIQVIYPGPLTVSVDTVAHCNIGNESDSDLGPETVPAVWAGADQDDCDTEVVDWSGSNMSLTGGVHSNGDINDGGSGNAVNGTSTSVGDLKNGGSNINFSPSLSTGSSSQTDPFISFYPYSRFAAGGDIYQAASALNRIVVYTGGKMDNSYLTGSCQMNGVTCLSGGVLQDGIYVSTYNDFNAIELSASDIHGDGGVNDYANVTFIAPQGHISINGSNQRLAPYIGNGDAAESTADLQNLHGFLAISYWEQSPQDKKCSSKNFYNAGSNSDLAGLIYTPYGQAEMDGSNWELIGCILGYTVKLNGSNNNIFCDDTWFPEVTNEPPSISITK